LELNAETVLAIKDFVLSLDIHKWELTLCGIIGLVFWRLPTILQHTREMLVIRNESENKSKLLNDRIKRSEEKRKRKQKRKQKGD